MVLLFEFFIVPFFCALIYSVCSYYYYLFQLSRQLHFCCSVGIWVPIITCKSLQITFLFLLTIFKNQLKVFYKCSGLYVWLFQK